MLNIHFVIVAAGTIGDTQPLLALGRALQERDHSVVFMAPLIWPEVQISEGLEIVSLSTSEELEQWTGAFWTLATRYENAFLRHSIKWNARIYQYLRASRAKNTVILTVDREFIWADTCAMYHLGVPVMRIHLDPPLMDGYRTIPPQLGRTIAQARLGAVAAELWSQEASVLGITAGRNHLARLTRARRRYMPAVGLYPSWLLTPKEAAVTMRQFGFLLDDQNNNAGASQEKAGEEQSGDRRKCIIFSSGTVGLSATWAPRFFQTAYQVCQDLQCRGLFVGAGGQEYEDAAPDEIVWRSYYPLMQAAAHALAIVHHGGIGTAAIALKHGIRQLIVPRVFQQPSNAARFRHLGLARVLAPGEFNVRSASAALRSLLADEDYDQRAHRLATDAYARLDDVAEFLEHWAISAPRNQQSFRVPRHA